MHAMEDQFRNHAALQRCFDERRDPLDDPECRAWLAADPERLLAYARLREQLDILPGPAAQPQPVVRATPRGWWRLAALAAALLASAAWLLRDHASPAPSAPGPVGVVIAGELQFAPEPLAATVAVRATWPLVRDRGAALEQFTEWSVP
jgi:hypothetical protein